MKTIGLDGDLLYYAKISGDVGFKIKDKIAKGLLDQAKQLGVQHDVTSFE